MPFQARHCSSFSLFAWKKTIFMPNTDEEMQTNFNFNFSLCCILGLQNYYSSEGELQLSRAVIISCVQKMHVLWIVKQCVLTELETIVSLQDQLRGNMLLLVPLNFSGDRFVFKIHRAHPLLIRHCHQPFPSRCHSEIKFSATGGVLWPSPGV